MSLVPPAAVGSEKTGDTGVARVGDVKLSLCQVPGDPGVDRSHFDIPAFGWFDLVHEPGELGRRFARRQSEALALQLQAGTDGTQVLPTQAGPTGSPVRPSQATAEALWVVTPTASIGADRTGESRCCHVEGGCRHSGGIELDQTRHGHPGREGAR